MTKWEKCEIVVRTHRGDETLTAQMLDNYTVAKVPFGGYCVFENGRLAVIQFRTVSAAKRYVEVELNSK